METLTFWTSASIILLALEMMVLMLIPGAILFISIKGLRAMERKMREVSPKVQGVFRQANLLTHQAADKIAAPVIKVEATNAQVRAIGRGTASLIKRREV
jgi:uncharacterized protein YoxC